MSTNDRELLAGLRILAITAKADGKLRDEERHALEGALADLRGGGHVGLPRSVDELLGEDFSVLIEEEFLRSDEARQRVYDACLLLANADGEASPEELALLDRLKPGAAEPTLLEQAIHEAADTILPMPLDPIHDPVRRDEEVREDIFKYAVLSAALGALPVPGVTVVTDLAVVGFQIKMVRDIGYRFGHPMDDAAIRSLIGTTAGSVIMRVAINNFARLVPGWGSIVGAASSFASTMAIGEVAKAYFEAGGAVSAAELRKRYEEEYQRSRGSYDQHAPTVEATRTAHDAKLRQLAEARKAGQLNQAEYERAISELR